MLHDLQKGDRVRVIQASVLERYPNISPGVQGTVRSTSPILVILHFENEDAIEASFMSGTEAGICLEKVA